MRIASSLAVIDDSFALVKARDECSKHHTGILEVYHKRLITTKIDNNKSGIFFD